MDDFARVAIATLLFGTIAALLSRWPRQPFSMAANTVLLPYNLLFII